jgi:exonuclease-1
MHILNGLDRYVDFAMSRVRMLKHFGITPYLVFDGDYLPSKSKTEKERSARRKESRRLGLELLNLGKTSQAYLELQKAVDVTPEMAGALMEELKRASVQYIVAPYEADSQMVYLEKKGIIHGILSEDSDLLVFGAKVLLTKLDQYGECIQIRRADFTACREVSFVGWSDAEFRQMAILSGCDYLGSIDKMGLKTAYRLLRKHRTLEKVLRALRFEAKFKVPEGYQDAFEQAERTFLFQWVYCPEEGGLVHFTPLPEGITDEDLPFVGKYVEAKLASGVARGALHPHTKAPLNLPEMPARRWMGPPSKTPSVAQTPDLKKHKSIDTFFKPARTPLAELDVNLFTGSPSQQDMARRASGSSWPATSVPANSTTPATFTRPPILPASEPIAARRAFSDNATLCRTTSERAPKRPRLCVDGSSPVSLKHAERIEYGTSKFFGTPATAAAPSRQKKSKSAKAEFNLWSDDSLDEALSQLPMPEVLGDTMIMKKKIDVFDDSTAKTLSKDASVEVETQVTTVSTVFSQSQDGAEEMASPPSEVDEVDDLPATPFDIGLKAEISDLRSKFLFKPSTPVQLSRASQTSKSRERPQASSRPRLGGRLSTSKTLPQVDGVVGTRKTSKSTGGAVVEDVEVPGSDAAAPPSPSVLSKTSHPVDIDPIVRSERALGGSEDMLVSESEAEPSEPGTPRASAFSLNLGRFAFGAA